MSETYEHTPSLVTPPLRGRLRFLLTGGMAREMNALLAQDLRQDSRNSDVHFHAYGNMRVRMFQKRTNQSRGHLTVDQTVHALTKTTQELWPTDSARQLRIRRAMVEDLRGESGKEVVQFRFIPAYQQHVDDMREFPRLFTEHVGDGVDPRDIMLPDEGLHVGRYFPRARVLYDPNTLQDRLDDAVRQLGDRAIVNINPYLETTRRAPSRPG